MYRMLDGYLIPPQGGCDRQSLGAANGLSATVAAAVTLGPPPQLVLFGETSSVPPFLLFVLRRPRPLGLGLTILFAPGGISFTFINEAGMAGLAFLHALEPERRRPNETFSPGPHGGSAGLCAKVLRMPLVGKRTWTGRQSRDTWFHIHRY